MQKIYCYEESPLTEEEINKFKTEKELINFIKKGEELQEDNYYTEQFILNEELRKTIYKMLNDNFLTAKDYIADKEYSFIDYDCQYCHFNKLRKMALYVAEHYEKSILICICIPCASNYLIYDEKQTKA